MPLSTDPLGRVLFANAFFSATSGLAFATGAVPLAAWLGIRAPWVLGLVGLGLLGFSAYLLWLVRRGPRASEVLQIAWADASWVLGTVVLLALFPDELSLAGKVAASACALVVGVFALLQVRAARQTGSTSGRAALNF